MEKLLKDGVKYIFRKFGYEIIRWNPSALPRDFIFPLITEDGLEVIRSALPYTMTSPERIYALIQTAKYIIVNNIPGDVVECGCGEVVQRWR